jgi:hypothetical protein
MVICYTRRMFFGEPSNSLQLSSGLSLYPRLLRSSGANPQPPSIVNLGSLSTFDRKLPAPDLSTTKANLHKLICNSPGMNTCTKSGRGWGHIVTLVPRNVFHVGRLRPGARGAAHAIRRCGNVSFSSEKSSSKKGSIRTGESHGNPRWMDRKTHGAKRRRKRLA